MNQVSGQTLRRRRLLGQTVTASLLAGPVGLAACGLPSQSTPAQLEKEVTLSYLTDWPTVAVRAAFLNTYVPKFTEENPKIKVQVESAMDVNVTALANAAAGTMQDVTLGGQDLFIQLLKGGGWKDIAPVLKSMKFNMEDLVYINSSIKYQGKQYGLPFQPNIAMLTINKTMFKKANVALPDDKTTYPQLLELLQKVANPDQNIYGMETRFGTSQWAHFIWAWGGDILSPDFKKTTIDQPAAIEGLQFMFDMLHRYKVGTPIDDKNAMPPGVARANGNLAVAYTSSPINGLGKATADLFELDYMYHPLSTKTNKRYVPQGDQPNVVTGSADQHGVLNQAVKFIVWLASSKTAQGGMAANGPEVPTLKSALNDPSYLKPPPASMRIVFDEVPSHRELVVFRGAQEWTLATRAALIPAFLGQRSVPDAAREATRAGDAVLAKYAS